MTTMTMKIKKIENKVEKDKNQPFLSGYVFFLLSIFLHVIANFVIVFVVVVVVVIVVERFLLVFLLFLIAYKLIKPCER